MGDTIDLEAWTLGYNRQERNCEVHKKSSGGILMPKYARGQFKKKKKKNKIKHGTRCYKIYGKSQSRLTSTMTRSTRIYRSESI